MRILGPLIVVLVASAGISANGASFRDVASPDADIDELALKRERLREELRERAFARAEKEKEQYEEALNTGDMQELKRDVLEKRSDPEPVTTESTPDPPVAAPLGAQKLAASNHVANHVSNSVLNNVVFIAVVAGCSVAGLVGLVVAGVCWYRLQKNVKAASEAEYPAYGITGPTKERVQSPGDRKLAQSAQMYHYQHQKQQMIALEKANSEMKQDGSDEDSEEENEEGDYTVYECPGLAPTGEMEVKNPLFSEDTPVTPTAPGNK